MKGKMTRRTFLLTSTLAIVGAAGGFWLFKEGYFNRSDRIARILLAAFDKRIAFLQWDRMEVKQFIQDFMADARNAAFIQKVNKLSYMYPIYTYTNLLEMTHYQNKIQNFEERVISRFLLSTDFFLDNADETQPVTYLSYYDPHRSPCQNPFSQWQEDIV